MKTAIIHVSIHHHNTQAVAQAMGEAIGSKVMTVEKANEENLSEYDLVGLGSGIFFSSHHRALLRWVREHSPLPARAFLFSTAGLPSLHWFWHRALREAVTNQQIVILGEACFPGWDTVGPLRWIGGIQRGHPNAHDLEQARQFAARMVACAHADGLGR
ncbi:MAG: flavodoxin domain-containing protein [Planctomycetota bacterium]|jgi:flavodoxin